MHILPSLLPSNASCCSLDSATVSSQSSPSPPIMDDLDDRGKERLLRQTRKLSQILGELPLEVTAQPHQATSYYGPPVADTPSADQPHQRRQYVRFSRHSFMGTPSRSFRFPLSSAVETSMSPQILPSARDALGRSSSTRRPSTSPTHPNQLDLARLGLGRLRRVGSTRSTQSNESSRRASHIAVTEKRPTRSTSLRILEPVHEARPKDKWRRQSVHEPVTVALHGPSPKSADVPTPIHSQRRSVSFWIRRRTMKDATSHQQRLEADQDRENDDASDDTHPPLTEAQRIQSLRRRRKLAHVCTWLMLLIFN